MAIEFKLLTDEQLIAIISGNDPLKAQQAKRELDRREERMRFWRNFFFPNLWSVLSLIVALYVAWHKVAA